MNLTAAAAEHAAVVGQKMKVVYMAYTLFI
jgi:hypothetical protein